MVQGAEVHWESGAGVGAACVAAAGMPARIPSGPLRTAERALALPASASPPGTLHPPGGGDGGDGAGNEHERNRGSD